MRQSTERLVVTGDIFAQTLLEIDVVLVCPWTSRFSLRVNKPEASQCLPTLPKAGQAASHWPRMDESEAQARENQAARRGTEGTLLSGMHGRFRGAGSADKVATETPMEWVNQPAARNDRRQREGGQLGVDDRRGGPNVQASKVIAGNPPAGHRGCQKVKPVASWQIS
jgi:hypothetical protein